MAKRKSIVSSLLFLLLLFFSNNEVCNSFLSSGSPAFNIRSYSSIHSYSLCNSGKADSGVSTNYPSIKKDWIKVRFMGGEYRFDASFSAVRVNAPAFESRVQSGDYASFISSSHHSLSKLRGPPVS
jgi:hypothetical protein